MRKIGLARETKWGGEWKAKEEEGKGACACTTQRFDAQGTFRYMDLWSTLSSPAASYPMRLEHHHYTVYTAGRVSLAPTNSRLRGDEVDKFLMGELLTKRD